MLLRLCLGCCALPLAGCAVYTAGQEVAAAQRLRAPLSVPRPSFFHAALLVPQMETAQTLPADTVVAALESNHSDAKATRTFEGVESFYHGCFHEWIAANVHWGAWSGVELSLRTAVGGWDEVLDHFLLRDESGNLIVRDEERLTQGKASQRHENVTHVDLGGKVELLGGGDAPATTAFATGLKIPIARPGDLTNAGTYDVAATLLESVDLGAVTLHGECGAVWPLGQQTLFHPDENIDLNPFAQGALGANWVVAPDWALDLQVQANTSAFRDVQFLRQGPISIVGGGRHRIGAGFVELSFGHGLDRESGDQWELFFSCGRAF